MVHAGVAPAPPPPVGTDPTRPPTAPRHDVRGPGHVAGGQAPRHRSVAIVGLGYVGLPTALAFADAGLAVHGIDASPERLAAIGRGDVDLIPADVERLARHRGGPDLHLHDRATALAEADAVIVCVPTPVDDHLGPDLRFLAAACADVSRLARRGQTIVLTSTTYVGCTRELLCAPLEARGLVPGRDLHVAFSPERIDPANSTFPQDRVPRVVGGVTPACTAAAAEVVGRVAPVVHPVSSPELAEMTKLVENTFRAVNIALANEFADIGRALGLDVVEAIDAAATKPYGFMPFYPGPGVGGHCIPCDPHYLLWQLRAERVPAPLISEAMTSIAQRPHHVVARAGEALSDRGRGLAGAEVLVVGVSYKPGVADVRESPAIEIIAGLEARGASVRYWDPHVPSVRLPGGRTITGITDPAATAPDLVVLHTRHPEADLGFLVGGDGDGDGPTVLDATFRCDDAPDRVVP